MRQLQLTILLILTLTQNVISQDKVIKGDTAFWYGWKSELIDKLELTDFNKSKSDFTFRFWNIGQVIEIIKDNDQLSGQLINYIYHLDKKTDKKSDTIFNKIQIDSNKVIEIYNLIQNSSILTLQSDDKIDGWTQGCDGINYIIEHSDNSEYWFKNYWTPSAQDSIPESLIVLDFVKKLSDTLQLPSKYKTFEKEIPQKGCYNSGGMTMMCFIPNSYGIGLIGSKRLPYGYQFSIYQERLGKHKIGLIFNGSQMMDFKGQLDLNLQIGKGNIVIKKNNKLSDFISYSYNYRKLRENDTLLKYSNNKIIYGLAINRNIDIACGFDYLNSTSNDLGGIIYTYKWFSKPKIGLVATTSIFNNHIDYRLGISKSIYFNRRFPTGLAIGIDYEKFFDFEDLKLSLMIRL